MDIIDLTSEHEALYFCCLEDWSSEIREAGNHKACWYAQMKDRGLRVKMARDDAGNIGGMIQYVPAELSFVEGKDVYVVLCIWVHGHKQGRGNFQKRGMGQALLRAAEEDVRNLGAKGIAAWGIILPFFMRASWFKKQGYQVADRDGMIRLLWKPFQADAVKPVFIKQKRKPDLTPGKVQLSLFLNGWCPAQNMVYERAKKAIEGYEGYVEVKEYNTQIKSIQREWGITDAFFVNHKRIPSGPPASYQKIRNMISRQVKKLAHQVVPFNQSDPGKTTK